MFYLYSREGVTCLVLPTPYRLKIANFSYPPLIWHLCLGRPPSNLCKSFTVPKTRVFQAADGENLVILACTVSDWSIHVTDGQTDGQTEFRWLKRATAVDAIARNKIMKTHNIQIKTVTCWNTSMTKISTQNICSNF